VQWFMYCENCLEELMNKNKKVLENLKNTWQIAQSMI
jgi:hypothetical protein